MTLFSTDKHTNTYLSGNGTFHTRLLWIFGPSCRRFQDSCSLKGELGHSSARALTTIAVAQHQFKGFRIASTANVFHKELGNRQLPQHLPWSSLTVCRLHIRSYCGTGRPGLPDLQSSSTNFVFRMCKEVLRSREMLVRHRRLKLTPELTTRTQGLEDSCMPQTVMGTLVTWM